MKIAVVTGASSGIGREFALQIDRREALDEIWLIARRRERLEALGSELRAKARQIALDLTEPESFEVYRKLLAAEKPEVRALVNNAGFGVFGAFTERSLDQQLKIIDLNDKAPVAMAYLTLPYMGDGAEIYNVASSSAFQPVPYIAVYGASKAFAMSFSRALGMELKPRGIRSIAVCPHWCRTEFFDTAVTDDTVRYYNFFNRPEDVVAAALRDMRRGRDVSICLKRLRFQQLLAKLLPHSLVMRVWCWQQKKPC